MAEENEVQECLYTSQELLEKLENRVDYSFEEGMKINVDSIYDILSKLESELDEQLTILEEKIEEIEFKRQSHLDPTSGSLFTNTVIAGHTPTTSASNIYKII